jgi:hypothetical protein
LLLLFMLCAAARAAHPCSHRRPHALLRTRNSRSCHAAATAARCAGGHGLWFAAARTCTYMHISPTAGGGGVCQGSGGVDAGCCHPRPLLPLPGGYEGLACYVACCTAGWRLVARRASCWLLGALLAALRLKRPVSPPTEPSPATCPPSTLLLFAKPCCCAGLCLAALRQVPKEPSPAGAHPVRGG